VTRPRTARRHAPMAMHHVDVAAVRDVTPGMRRITLSGPSLAAFADDGPDQRFKLFLPRPGQHRPPVTGGDGWYREWLALPHGERPVMRTYTVRHARPELQEIDVDIVRHGAGGHGSGGPGSAWAERATAGDRVAMFGAYAEYDPPPGTRWQVLVGDETALPAIAAACERLPAGTGAHVVVEVADATEEQPLAGDVAVTWVHRGADRLAGALRALRLPRNDSGYAWVGGEAASVKAVRRQLIAEHGLSRDRVTFMGYWKRGEAVDPT
jgi:NADPH-dependent ferric siderophore reductase